jgi:AAA15 family ATPase/GTPase
MSIMRVMIHLLAIQNFSSFHEPTLVEFTAGAKAGDRDIFLESSQAGVSVNSVTGILGPNASGKTNLLKAIAFLRYFIMHSASEKPDAKIPVEAFNFVEGAAERHAPILFRLEFEYEAKLYRYELKLDHQRVQFEALYRKDQRFRYLFERSWNMAEGDYDLKAQDIGPSKQIAQRENASFLASSVLQEHAFAKYISGYFKTCYVNVHIFGRMTTHDPESMNVLDASDYFSERQDYLADAIKHIAHADTGISSIDLDPVKVMDQQGKEQEVLFPMARHTVAGVDYKRPLVAESRGTQALFVLLRYILPVLETGGVAVIDEFETGLHSHVVKYVVELFYSKVTNPKGAQLIANFHTDYLLQSTLEKYQIVFTEKNPETQSTEAWRLDKVKGAARNANNHYAKYHAGAYGGIPNL